jgi:hypothetical protein
MDNPISSIWRETAGVAVTDWTPADMSFQMSVYHFFPLLIQDIFTLFNNLEHSEYLNTACFNAERNL